MDQHELIQPMIFYITDLLNYVTLYVRHVTHVFDTLTSTDANSGNTVKLHIYFPKFENI